MTEETANKCIEYFKKYDRVNINISFDEASANLSGYKTSDIKVRKYLDDSNEEWRVDIKADRNHFIRFETPLLIGLGENRLIISYNKNNEIEFEFYNAEQ